MSKTESPTNNNNQKSDSRLDVISTRHDEHILKINKARKLIGKIIQKDGQDFGKIVEIITIGDKIVAVTKKYCYNPGEMEIDETTFRIDVASSLGCLLGLMVARSIIPMAQVIREG